MKLVPFDGQNHVHQDPLAGDIPLHYDPIRGAMTVCCQIDEKRLEQIKDNEGKIYVVLRIQPGNEMPLMDIMPELKMRELTAEEKELAEKIQADRAKRQRVAEKKKARKEKRKRTLKAVK